MCYFLYQIPQHKIGVIIHHKTSNALHCLISFKVSLRCLWAGDAGRGVNRAWYCNSTCRASIIGKREQILNLTSDHSLSQHWSLIIFPIKPNVIGAFEKHVLGERANSPSFCIFFMNRSDKHKSSSWETSPLEGASPKGILNTLHLQSSSLICSKLTGLRNDDGSTKSITGEMGSEYVDKNLIRILIWDQTSLWWRRCQVASADAMKPRVGFHIWLIIETSLFIARQKLTEKGVWLRLGFTLQMDCHNIELKEKLNFLFNFRFVLSVEITTRARVSSICLYSKQFFLLELRQIALFTQSGNFLSWRGH